MKIDDELLEALGNAYCRVCNKHGVMVKDGWVVTFEAFIRDFFRFRARRQRMAA